MKSILVSENAGNFSSLNLVFLLERDPGYYLIHMFLPLCLTVLMSWHALWLKVEIPQARLVLTVNCILTVVTVSNGVRTVIPKVSYLKAADVWITTCILFIYGVILLSSMVNYMSRMKLRPIIMRKIDQGFGDIWHVRTLDLLPKLKLFSLTKQQNIIIVLSPLLGNRT